MEKRCTRLQTRPSQIGDSGCQVIPSEAEQNHKSTEKAPPPVSGRRGVTLATSYFRTTWRCTIIGAAAFNFRVRNGNGWVHCARITRRLRARIHLPRWRETRLIGSLTSCLPGFWRPATRRAVGFRLIKNIADSLTSTYRDRFELSGRIFKVIASSPE